MVSRCQTTSGYMTVLFISIHRMPLLGTTLEITDPFYVLVINIMFLSGDKHHVSIYKQIGSDNFTCIHLTIFNIKIKYT